MSNDTRKCTVITLGDEAVEFAKAKLKVALDSLYEKGVISKREWKYRLEAAGLMPRPQPAYYGSDRASKKESA
ncbi:MAG TPA: hypothetical protein PKW73_03090 [Candidatus Obscuribacter sp.]|nr:hypothetical protein [Candidatus Obscuribacter sp.]HNA72293.1 hypothetical protein [Candidatus Obscuribacter sp.]